MLIISIKRNKKPLGLVVITYGAILHVYFLVHQVLGIMGSEVVINEFLRLLVFSLNFIGQGLRIWIALSQLSNIGFTVLAMLVLGVIEP
jgi:protein-S-isoprenylcysteine O-methyltransferase Ste14